MGGISQFISTCTLALAIANYLCRQLLRSVKDWDQLNFTMFTMSCKHSYSKMKSNEVM